MSATRWLGLQIRFATGGSSGGGWALGGMGIAGVSGAVLVAGTGVGAVSITLGTLLSSSSPREIMAQQKMNPSKCYVRQ